MAQDWSKDYPLVAQLTEENLDENNSIRKMLNLIGNNQRVVDFGCATGYLAQILNQKGCIVTGVEINSDAAQIAAQYCQEVIVADLDFVSVQEILPSQEFDVAVFGDVLEHLRNPWKVLSDTKDILKKDGYVVASIPNIGHGAIRLALLQGKFEYTELGILDNTHLRFFTRETVEELFTRAGYLVTNQDRTKLEIFSESSLVPQHKKEQFNTDIINQIEADADAETLQFIIRAEPGILETEKAVIHNSGYQLFKESQQLQSQLQKTQAQLQRSQSQLQQLQAQLEQSQSQLQETQAALEQSNTTIAAMETSKFWKLRRLWFKIKERLGKLLVIFPQLSSMRLAKNTFSPHHLVDQVLPPSPISKHSLTVDVIVCVHNALDDVKNCLQSVVRYSSMPYSIIIVDDGSNAETCQYLAEFAITQGATLIRNEVAKGYTFAANQGLKKSKADYVILLNSDTIVTPKWLDRIVACGESDPKIGLIGPLSNTASWQSIPEISENGDWAENKLPLGMTVSYMGKLVADYSRRLYPRIPFLNGFCLAIKRRAIASLGYFDEQTFGAGYGEENDYCLRAKKAGWELAIADDTYIYHSQSRSYSHERRKLLCDRADQALIAKHGQQIISEGVTVCRFDRVIAGIRSRSRVMLSRQKFIEEGKSRWEGKRVLIILPILHPGGGGNVVFQEAAAMQKMGVDVRIVNFNRHRPIFEQGYPDNNIPIIYVENEDEIPHLLSKYDAVIATLYKSVYWLKILNQDEKFPVRGYYIQDFEPYFFPEASPEYQIALQSYNQYADLVKFTKTEWNRDLVNKQTQTDCVIIGPSVNIDLYRPSNRRDPNWPQRPLRIAAMIRPDTPRRAAGLTMKVLQKIYQIHGNNIQIVIFGCESNDPQFTTLTRDFSFDNAGILTRSQLASLLNEIDIFVDFSSFQAMGLTAMEAMACGAAVIVPKAGGASSFAIHEKNSLIVDTSSDENCFQELNRLISDQELRQKLQQTAINDICQYFPEKAAYKILDALFTTQG
ncbi:type 11 methyltransferase [Calothrix brevissima NIES-22]|nr:type 11 methyltransferase [Calothrix brevissima NIES-22]